MFKQPSNNKGGFTLIESIAVLILLGILSAVAATVFLNFQDSAKDRALDGALATLNGREQVAWSRVMLEAQGVEDTTIFSHVDANNLGNHFVWASTPERTGISYLSFQDYTIGVLRTASSTSSPGVWRQLAANGSSLAAITLWGRSHLVRSGSPGSDVSRSHIRQVGSRNRVSVYGRGIGGQFVFDFDTSTQTRDFEALLKDLQDQDLLKDFLIGLNNG